MSDEQKGEAKERWFLCRVVAHVSVLATSEEEARRACGSDGTLRDRNGDDVPVDEVSDVTEQDE